MPSVRFARPTCLALALALVAVAACGGDSSGSRDRSTTTEQKAARTYASTPRKALESWVAAARAGDLDMICRLLRPQTACATPAGRSSLLSRVQEEMRGLSGDVRYGAVNAARGVESGNTLIGVVSGSSPRAYAVPLARGVTQWNILNEFYSPSPRATAAGAVPHERRINLNRPNPAVPLTSGRAQISVTFWAGYGSGFPLRDVWIDGRRIDGRYEVHPEDSTGSLTPAHWTGTAQLRSGRHLLVAVVRGSPLTARAWLLTVR
jgi:hypothetical protein